MKYNKVYKFLSLIVCCICISSDVFSQLVVTPSASATILASTLAGPGVTILSPSLTCPAVANGTFTSVGTLLGMSGGIVLTTGHASACVGPNGAPPGVASFNNGAAGDPALGIYLPPGTNTYDACILQFDVVAAGDSIGFNYQFGSQEYYHSTCGQYPDIFAFFISGPGIVGAPNIALVPGTNIPVEINSVNAGAPGGPGGLGPGVNIVNCTSLGPGSPFTTYFINNWGGTQLSYTGFTTKLRAAHVVNPCDTYHLKLSIADADNGIFDSGVFLEAGSLTPPTIPAPAVLCVGGTATLTSPTTGGTWTSGNTAVATIGVTSGIVTGVSGGTATISYSVGPNCALTTIVTVNAAAPISGTPFACTGGTTTLTDIAGGGTWSSSDTTVATIGSLTGIVSGVSIGTTIISYTTAGGCNINIVVTINPIAPVTGTPILCIGGTTTLTDAVTGGTWSSSNTTVATIGSFTGIVNGLSAGTSTIIYQTAAGCNASIIVTVNSLSANILTPDTTICGGSSLTILVSGTTGATYNWTPATGLSSSTAMDPVATPTITTTYTLTVSLPGSTCPPVTESVNIAVTNTGISILTPDTSFCIGQSVHILVNGSDSLTYLWTPATGLDSGDVKDPVATPTVTTTYVVNATSVIGCSATAAITISVVNVTAEIVTPDTAICKGASVQVIATGDPSVTYQWLPTAGIPVSTILDPIITPDTSAIYYLTGFVPGCNGIMDSIKIDVQPTPIVYIGGSRSVCKHDTIHINASVLPQWYTHYIYNWSPGTGLDNTSTPSVFFTAGDSTEILLTVTTPAGCKGVDSAELMVHSIGQVSIHDTTICPHDSIQLKPVSLDTPLTYQWHPAIYLSDSNAADPWVYAITSQNYRAIVTNRFGCHDTIAANINVHSNAVIYLGDSVTIYPGESYQITPQTNCTSFIWFPATGLNDAYISNPVASPEINTKYTVIGATEWGCKTKDSIDIYIGNTLLALPNAFTPGSGPNNLLKVLKKGIATLNYFRIYNRWGNLVYESNDIDAGWDGTYHGVPQPFGVFVYVVEAVTNEGRIFSKHGNVTLIR